jgi:ABC-type nickel/cobalt efflux system permease component RcnA
MGEVEPQPTPPAPAREWTAIILAIGLSTAINAITIAVLMDAVMSKGPGLSENATQILTTAFGGIIGVLGSYIGYRSATSARDQGQADANAESVRAQQAAAAAHPEEHT